MGREGRRRVGGGLRVARALTVCSSLGETCWHEKPSAAAGSKRLERDGERDRTVSPTVFRLHYRHSWHLVASPQVGEASISSY